jgi:hypothetical protein
MTPDKQGKNINNGLTMLTETTLPSINVKLNPETERWGKKSETRSFRNT